MTERLPGNGAFQPGSVIWRKGRRYRYDAEGKRSRAEPFLQWRGKRFTSTESLFRAMERVHGSARVFGLGFDALDMLLAEAPVRVLKFDAPELRYAANDEGIAIISDEPRRAIAVTSEIDEISAILTK